MTRTTNRMRGSISVELLRRVRKASGSLPEDTLRRMREFSRGCRDERWAFRGRSRGEDIYYTAFGWMVSLALGTPPPKESMEAYLGEIDPGRLDFVHYCSFVKCSLLLAVSGRGPLSLLRSATLGIPPREISSFGSFPGDDRNSPYSLFLSLGLSQDLREGFEGKEALSSLNGYHLGGGLYSGTPHSDTPSLQATCSALMVRGYLEGFRKKEVEGLQRLQSTSGGFKASPLAPVPDMLSTAVALFTLSCHGMETKYPAIDFIEAHLDPSGGCLPTLLDREMDIEYLFYGLLAIGCL